jgi:hypothetical protein
VGYPFGKQMAYPQLGIVGSLSYNHHFFPISWESRKLRRVAFSVSHAELLGVLQGYSLGRWIQEFLTEILNVRLSIVVCSDSKIVCDLMETESYTMEKYMISSVQILRHELAMNKLKIIWTKGSSNLADGLTKRSIQSYGSIQRTFQASELNCAGSD